MDQITTEQDVIKKIRADDIKHANRLSNDEIANIPINRVYEWVRAGAWKTKDFNRWLKALRVIE